MECGLETKNKSLYANLSKFVLRISCKRIPTSQLVTPLVMDPKMDSNGNKVQTLRQQFEGLQKNETPTILQKSKKPIQLAKSNGISYNTGRNAEKIVSSTESNYKMLNTSFNTNNTRSGGLPLSNSLLKSGNRSGFIAASSNNAPTLLSSVGKLSSSSSSEQNNSNQDTDSTTSSDITIELNCGKLDPLSSPSLRNIRRKRNGIYVSDPITLFGSGENLVLSGQDVNNHSSSDNSLEDGDVNPSAHSTSPGELDTDDGSSGNSPSNRNSLHSSVNVKRSNAFRQRDVVDSPEPRFARNSKIVLDRVKSLELPRSRSTNEKKETTDLERANTGESKRASGLVVQPRPKSIASMTKAVNVVTPYQVSDIYPSQPDSTLFNSERRKSEMDQKGWETPEYAVPIPIVNRSESSPLTTIGKQKPPEPPKYPPPPPVYKSQCHPQLARPLTSFQQPIRTEESPQAREKRTAASQIIGRGPPPEKPPRTFLYDILSDQNHRLHTHKNSLTLLAQNSQARRGQPLTPERKSATMRMPSIVNSGDTLYKRSSSDKNLAKPKLAISTAKIRQTTPNSTVRARDGSLPQQLPVLLPQPNHSQMLVRSKTESQIILKNSKLRAGIIESPGLDPGSVPPIHRSLGRNAQFTYQSQLYLNQHGGQFNHDDQQQDLYDLMSNTNLLQQIQRRSNGRHATIHPLRSESNLVLSVKEEARLDSSFHLHNPNSMNSIHNHKLGLPPSPYYQTGKEFRISRQHSNSLLFTNNLIRLSSFNPSNVGPQDVAYNSSGLVNNRKSLDNRNQDGKMILMEKSKSEWALNRIGGYNNTNSIAVHNISSSGNIAARRNTIPTLPAHNLTTSISSSPIGDGSTPTTGHASLDSTTSTHSSGKLPRPGIQQSIQNLVNQLFSPTSSTSVIGNTTKEATSSTDSGIQLGSESLSSCDTPVGDSTTDTGDSDCENDVETSNNARQVVEARKGYIRRVSSIRVQEIPSIHRLYLQSSKKPHSGENLFECLLIVGLNRDPYTGVYHPYIRDKFPANAKVAAGVEQFCFPDSLEWPCHEGPTAQSYTLAITDHRGSRKYGCCYRILPEGANICIPIAYVIISAHRAIGFYREVLREITQRHGYAEYQKRYLMEDLFKKSFPAPMEDITVTDPLQDDMYPPYGQQGFNTEENLPPGYNNFLLPPSRTIVIRRKADQRLEEGDLVTLLTALDINILLKLFGSLLLERKVVLISRSLCTLSLCMEALESMLYPFAWQHTFVPILPLTMTDVLDAPAPFLIGCLRSLQTPWDKTLDEGIVIDLDQNKVLSSIGDENNILPKRIYRKLRTALQFVINMPDQKEHTKNVLTSECFIRMFVETLGHYSNHLVVHNDGVKTFDRDSFIKAADAKATQNFLEWFSETSMFHEFIELRLKGSPPPGLFEQRILEQSELNASTNGLHQSTQTAGTPLTFKNAKFFMKGSRPFGNWLKDAFVK